MAKKPIVINETTGQSEKQQLAIGDLSDATTIGQNVVKLANPGAITFPRFNADNTVDALSVVDFRTAIGAPAAFSFTLNGTAAATYTLPATSATLARIDAANKFVGKDFSACMISDPLIVGWTSIAQLKKYNGAYIMGGGRNECLREVELLMNAFNIKYKRINQLIYG